MKTKSGLFVVAAAAALISTHGFAQTPPIQFQPHPDSPIGARNPKAPAELKQLEFLIGDWRVAIVLHQPGGDLAYEARWHNSWIVNGSAVMQEWRGPYATGAELRSYDPDKGRWVGRNFYTGPNSWTESEGAFADGEFVIDTPSQGPDGAFLNRERYFDIQPNSFRMVARRSRDGGKTWSEPTYEMVCTRIA
ncbi:MAG: hypothetical protein GC203_14515 [Phenylobacterium sp.]|uniref:hypothetical protein n=1 Tax=Phenylobacterium sp. TaxID=1871053 RepID=UPI0025F1C11C|nr:hypothetical protein [Phenylobacterium sp.]MBI1199069.1 hypothetical protein [Phenylobacterium sp.]